MKSPIFLIYIFLISLLFFIDYVLMMLLGCITSVLGFGNDFYCGTYCLIGKIVLGATAVLFIFLIFTDTKESLKNLINATTKKEEKS